MKADNDNHTEVIIVKELALLWLSYVDNAYGIYIIFLVMWCCYKALGLFKLS